MKTYNEFNIWDNINENIMLEEYEYILKEKAKASLREQQRYIRANNKSVSKAELNRLLGLKSLHVLSCIEKCLGSDQYAAAILDFHESCYPEWANDPNFPEFNLRGTADELKHRLLDRPEAWADDEIPHGMDLPLEA